MFVDAETFFGSCVEQEEIAEYLYKHFVIDDFVWLLKLRYSDKKTIKTKKYRKDILFQEYIQKNKINISKISKALKSKNSDEQKFIYYLKQGWYNELATEYPFSKDSMNIGTNINVDETQWKVDLFPSWYIVKSYYTLYSYYTALVFTIDSNVRTIEHRKPTQYFNTNLKDIFNKVVLFYPFSIFCPENETIDKIRNLKEKMWEYDYAKCPRRIITFKKPEDFSNEDDYKEYLLSSLSDKKLNIYNVEMDYLNGLEKLTKKLNQRAPVNIIDMLFEFRVWANYAGSDTILQLKGGGYTKFLEKNLSTISFFMAGICEMVAIAFLGEKKYAKIFEEFYLGFIKGRDDLYKEWYNISIINRYRIYKSMGMVNVDIKNFTAPNIDPLKIVGK